jgi:hypothetical protein
LRKKFYGDGANVAWQVQAEVINALVHVAGVATGDLQFDFTFFRPMLTTVRATLMYNCLKGRGGAKARLDIVPNMVGPLDVTQLAMDETKVQPSPCVVRVEFNRFFH